MLEHIPSRFFGMVFLWQWHKLTKAIPTIVMSIHQRVHYFFPVNPVACNNYLALISPTQIIPASGPVVAQRRLGDIESGTKFGAKIYLLT